MRHDKVIFEENNDPMIPIVLAKQTLSTQSMLNAISNACLLLVLSNARYRFMLVLFKHVMQKLMFF
jgi:nitrogen-specific signal transduction histidine kinase